MADASNDVVEVNDTEAGHASTADSESASDAKRFEIVVCCLALIAPVLLVVVFLYSCYSGGNTIASDTVTETVLQNDDTRALVGTTTFITCSIYGFLCICRSVQIRVVFEARNQYSGKWKLLNRVGAGAGVTGFFFIFLASVVVRTVAHNVLILTGFVSVVVYVWIITAVSVKERKEEQQATGELYLWDVVIQSGLAIVSTISLCVYMGYYIVQCWSKGLDGSDGCKVDGPGNVCEWIGVITAVIIPSFFILTFRHADVYVDIQEWWIDTLKCSRYRAIS